jgi:hypothetical protein
MATPRKYLARDFKFYISEDDGTNYITISGVNSWSFTIDGNSEDTSTFDNSGWGSSMYTQRTGSISLEGFTLVDSVTGGKDSGQAAVENCATRLGYDAYRRFKVTQTTASGEIGHFTFLGQANLADRGGGTTDVDPWGCELLFEGKPTASGTFAYLNN